MVPICFNPAGGDSNHVKLPAVDHLLPAYWWRTISRTSSRRWKFFSMAKVTRLRGYESKGCCTAYKKKRLISSCWTSITRAIPQVARKDWNLLMRNFLIDQMIPLVVMTAWGNVDLAVEAMRRGASDFVQKPWNNRQLLEKVQEKWSAAED